MRTGESSPYDDFANDSPAPTWTSTRGQPQHIRITTEAAISTSTYILRTEATALERIASCLELEPTNSRDFSRLRVSNADINKDLKFELADLSNFVYALPNRLFVWMISRCRVRNANKGVTEDGSWEERAGVSEKSFCFLNLLMRSFPAAPC